jgi:hypothetical protein
MAFENELDALLFAIEQALRSCRVSPKPERNEFIRRFQAKAIVEHLARCGWRIVKEERDTGQQPTNIGA